MMRFFGFGNNDEPNLSSWRPARGLRECQRCHDMTPQLFQASADLRVCSACLDELMRAIEPPDDEMEGCTMQISDEQFCAGAWLTFLENEEMVCLPQGEPALCEAHMFALDRQLRRLRGVMSDTSIDLVRIARMGALIEAAAVQVELVARRISERQ